MLFQTIWGKSLFALKLTHDLVLQSTWDPEVEPYLFRQDQTSKGVVLLMVGICWFWSGKPIDEKQTLPSLGPPKKPLGASLFSCPQSWQAQTWGKRPIPVYPFGKPIWSTTCFWSLGPWDLLECQEIYDWQLHKT